MNKLGYMKRPLKGPSPALPRSVRKSDQIQQQLSGMKNRYKCNLLKHVMSWASKQPRAKRHTCRLYPT